MGDVEDTTLQPVTLAMVAEENSCAAEESKKVEETEIKGDNFNALLDVAAPLPVIAPVEGIKKLLEVNARFKHKRDLIYGSSSTTPSTSFE